jgi:ACS family D-galactonate transporter-like MFS transporter
MAEAEERADRYRWVILGVLWITYIVVFLHRLSVGPLAPFFKDDLGITSTQVGLVMSAASVGYMISLFPIGWVVDRIGARWPIVAGELIAGACMIALFFSPSYTWLLTLMFVTGLGCGFLLPSTTQGVVAWFPLRERATAMGLKQTAVNIGGIISASTLPALALAVGWRYCFLLLGIIAIAIGTAAYIFYKDPPGDSSRSTRPEAARAVSLVEILKTREIWLLACCGLCLAWVEMTVIAHIVLYLTEVLLFGVVAAGGFLAMTEAAGAIARPISGFLSDRVFGGNRKQVFMLMAGMASAMCFVVGVFGADLSWGLYPCLFIFGMGGIGFGGIYLTLLSEFGGRRGAGKAVGLSGIITLLGAALGPTFFGYLVDTFGSYKLAWLSLGFVASFPVLILLFVREHKRRI